jgi:hypothetical protein
MSASSSVAEQNFELKDVVTSLTTLIDVMAKLAIRFGSVEEKMDRLERKSQVVNEDHVDENWKDGAEFCPEMRPSIASTLSLATNKDAGTKLERPKFTVKLTKTIDGVKKEFIRDSDFLDYFDEYDHYILSWENLPMNLERRLTYPNKERVALLSLPIKYAQYLCSKLKIVFSPAMMQFKTPKLVREAVYWQELATADVRRRIGIKFAEEVSEHGAVEILQRIKFNSQFGLIDGQAFADYQHEFKKEIMRIQAGGTLKINAINMKDIVISALPDKNYQKSLYTKYGPYGSLILPSEDFAIDLIFDEVEQRITTVTKQGLRAVVNKATREREASYSKHSSHSKPVVGHVNHAEIDEMIEEQVNAAFSGSKSCRNVGVGKDGLLKCRFLGGPKGICTWEHPKSDMDLKAKGISKDTPVPQWLNTGKKAFHAVQDPFFDSFDTEEDDGNSYDPHDE